MAAPPWSAPPFFPPSCPSTCAACANYRSAPPPAASLAPAPSATPTQSAATATPFAPPRGCCRCPSSAAPSGCACARSRGTRPEGWRFLRRGAGGRVQRRRGLLWRLVVQFGPRRFRSVRRWQLRLPPAAAAGLCAAAAADQFVLRRLPQRLWLLSEPSDGARRAAGVRPDRCGRHRASGRSLQAEPRCPA